VSKRLLWLWCSVVSALPLLIWASQCRASARELHQITGSLFSFTPPPRSDGFRYGPFAGLTRDARFERIVARFSERLAQKRVPGAAVAVVLDGRLAYSAGVGVLRSSIPTRVEAQSRFRTASLSKMLLAATIMSLVERDGLELEAPLTKYLPYFARAKGYPAPAITLRMLLEHTAGVPDSEDRRLLGLKALITTHATDPLLSPPGRLFNYSNAGYALLAAVIEAKTGRPFEQVVAERVFSPAHMVTASYTTAANESGLSAGHDASRRVLWTRPRDNEASRAAGGVIASAVDYAHFAEVLLAGGENMLHADSVRAMMRGRALMQDEPRRLYGFGLIETEHEGLDVVEHAGSSSGFSTVLRMVPSRGFAVIVFDNGAFAPDEVADAAMSAFLEVPEAAPAHVPKSQEAWRAYVGEYEDVSGRLGRFAVRLRDGHLWLEEKKGGQRGELPRGLRGRFETDENGRVEYFVTRFGVASKRR
jgi:CubicO group peptidase (beta-lactamase class C family)